MSSVSVIESPSPGFLAQSTVRRETTDKSESTFLLACNYFCGFTVAYVQGFRTRPVPPRGKNSTVRNRYMTLQPCSAIACNMVVITLLFYHLLIRQTALKPQPPCMAIKPHSDLLCASPEIPSYPCPPPYVHGCRFP